MNKSIQELSNIVKKFIGSGWELIGEPSKEWLEATANLLKAVKQADIECGSCGCELDPLYKGVVALLED